MNELSSDEEDKEQKQQQELQEFIKIESES